MRKYLSLLLLTGLFVSCGNNEETNLKTSAGDLRLRIKDSASNGFVEQKLNPYAAVDVSPIDMAYFPADYPKLKMANQAVGEPLARVIYSRPHLQGRHIFHEVLKYGEPWRLGANESTELELFSDVSIKGKKIKEGRYVLYCIPQPDTWTVVINNNTDSWGLQPDKSKDIGKFEVPATKTNNSIEYFTIIFEKTNAGANLLMAWDDTEVRLPLLF
ncbi:MAG: DUF2911 domain-containing protein [Chitinophagaceae bacterium]|nr:DUF2911 domain-containing protein [Chitinophagaceae bacterium]